MESVLVIPTGALEQLLPGEGFISIGEDQLPDLLKTSLFLPRESAEGNPRYRQLIPYVVVVNCLGGIFTYTRLKGQSETRLHQKLSMGTGGHINPIDGVQNTNIIRVSAWRELREELQLPDVKEDDLVFCGLINDLSTPVSRDHLGCLLVLRTYGAVSVRETHKMTGGFLSIGELHERIDQLESWSRLILPLFAANGAPHEQ